MLRRLSHAFAGGTLTAIHGPSGVGKTTLLSAIVGLVPTSAGRIVRNGHDLSGVAPRRRGVAWMPQGGGLYPHLTVRQSLRIGFGHESTFRWRRRRRDVAAEASIEAVAASAGIDEWLDRYPDQISGGQARRASVVKAMFAPKPVCLLDEPFAQLDDDAVDRLADAVAGWHRRRVDRHGDGAVTVVVTHRVAVARRIADDVVRLRRDGSSDRLEPSP